MTSFLSETILQLFTVEYTVTRRVDFTTTAPLFSIDPSSPDFLEPDDDQIYRPPPVEVLGFVDPDAINGGGAMGDRFVYVDDFQTPVIPAVPEGTIAVVARFESDVLPQVVQELGPAVSGEITYDDGCLFIPQGSGVSFGGIELADDDPPIRIRLQIVTPKNREDLARLLEQCCCIDEEEEPTPTPPCEITDVLPTFVVQDAISDVSVTGTNLPDPDEPCTLESGDPGTIGIAVFPDGGDPSTDSLPTSGVTEVSPGTNLLANDVDFTGAALGSYTVAIVCISEDATPIAEVLCQSESALSVIIA